MDLAEKIRDLALNLPKQLVHIQTEEATKNALIMPFIAALGYNVFNPAEVTPELHADVGLKKGEKVDYAILREGKPIILFECKWHGADLSKEHASQLYRYFSVTEARFGVLTNGIAYRFYTDLEARNKMDSTPFYEFNLASYRDTDLEELKRFSFGSYDLNDILTTASELKYTREIQRLLTQQFQSPDDEFVRFFASKIHTGRMAQAVREQFTQATQRALKQFVTDQVNDRLKTALGAGAQVNVVEHIALPAPTQSPESIVPEDSVAALITTTSEELECYYTIRALLFGTVDIKRIVMRDVQSYCGILLDDNNRKPICRLYFNSARKSLGLFDGEGRKEVRVPVASIDDIHQYSDRLRATVEAYEKAKAVTV